MRKRGSGEKVWDKQIARRQESIGETCVSSAALALSSLRSPGPLPTSLSTESIHAELTPSPLKKRCKYFNCLLLTKIHV